MHNVLIQLVQEHVHVMLVILEVVLSVVVSSDEILLLHSDVLPTCQHDPVSLFIPKKHICSNLYLEVVT